jgi:hypothetical protein
MMRRVAFVALAVCSACVVRRTTIVVPFQATLPPERAAVTAVNDTGRELPMPQAGIIEQAVRVVSRQPQSDGTISGAFARAATARLVGRHVSVVPSDTAAAAQLQVHLTGWDVRDGASAGGVVFVSADYRLLDAQGTVLWEVKQDRLPVRLAGPNLSRHEVGRIADASVDAAFASLLHRQR